MTGLRRLSDVALSGAASGATTGQVPTFSSVGRYAPGAATPIPLGITSIAKAYRPDIQLYNASGSSLRKFRAGLAKARNGEKRANIVCVGDSVIAGYQASGPTGKQYLNSWPTHMRDLLTAQFGVDTGTGLVKTNAAGGGGVTAEDYGEDRFSYSGSWSALGGGISNRCFAATGTGNTITIGPIVTDRVRIYAMTFSNAGTWSYTVDGGSSVTVTQATSTGIAYTDISVTAGSHTIVITAPSSGYLYFCGFEASKNGTLTGCAVHAQGYNGQTANGFNNFTLGGGAAGTGGTLLFDTIQPDLTVIGFGTNEVAAGAPSTYSAAMQTLITRARATGDVVLVSLFTGTVNAGTTLAAYNQIIYGLADTNDICVLDLNDRFGGYAGANGSGLMADTQHPSTRGYWDIGTAVAKALIAVTV